MEKKTYIQPYINSIRLQSNCHLAVLSNGGNASDLDEGVEADSRRFWGVLDWEEIEEEEQNNLQP